MKVRPFGKTAHFICFPISVRRFVVLSHCVRTEPGPGKTHAEALRDGGAEGKGRGAFGRAFRGKALFWSESSHRGTETRRTARE